MSSSIFRPGNPKERIGAAAGSDLECILRANGRTHLALLGIATSGVVLSTARWAADADYTTRCAGCEVRRLI